MSTKPYPELGRFESEKYFLNEKNEKCLFPSINEPASVELSVIVPAYNEEERCRYFAVTFRNDTYIPNLALKFKSKMLFSF